MSEIRPGRPVPASVQILEGRGFRRLYEGQPLYQERFVESILGLVAEAEMTHDPRLAEVRRCAGGLLSYFIEQHGEFLQPRVELDGDHGAGVYESDSRVAQQVEELVGVYEQSRTKPS